MSLDYLVVQTQNTAALLLVFHPMLWCLYNSVVPEGSAGLFVLLLFKSINVLGF